MLKMQSDRTTDAGTFPKVVLIDTISYCNLKCSMCGHKGMKRKRGRMDFNLYCKIIDEIAARDKDIRVWLVFFGEALLLKKDVIYKMIKYAKQQGLTDVVLNSNGNLLDKEMAQVLIEAGLDAIYVGIDSTQPEVYSRIRVGGNYERVVENVIGLIKLKKELKSEKPEVFTQFVVMDENENQVDEFVRFWTNEGAIAKIRPKVSWAGLVQASNLVIPREERWPCYWAMQTMSITNEGKVVLCAVDVDARFVAGDINQQSLYEVWNGRLKEIRQLQTNGQYNLLPFPCNDCLDWQSARADYYDGEEK
ncbi:MAG: radical SAM protein [Syntrophomonadaceae bacterium]|jgi:radical SAM protein with 4Fe4S-binding SPASM domain|nr:radical SAM protein [Syntrophomonadaceae bacterium]